MSKNIYTFHYTYLIVNKNSQMKYIGVRSCDYLPENDDEYMGSSKILVEAMQKTPEVFTKTIIDTFPTREIANTNEQWLHETYDVARNSEFYNRMNAPLGFCNAGKTGKDSHFYGKHHSAETKKKMSDSMLGEKHHYYGKKFTEEHRKKLSDSKKGQKHGKKHTEESKKKMSVAMSGENNPNYGKKRSDATKRKISESQRGKNNPFFGKKHSPESKKKMSKIQKGRIHSPETKKKIGESNRGKIYERITCPNCNKTGGNNNMKRWHFINCREIA
jgi:hypothetical protein